MQSPQSSRCLPSFNFADCLKGRTRNEQKARLEQNLCGCDDCFETLIETFNQ